jgi:hypothetical protein
LSLFRFPFVFSSSSFFLPFNFLIISHDDVTMGEGECWK